MANSDLNDPNRAYRQPADFRQTEAHPMTVETFGAVVAEIFTEAEARKLVPPDVVAWLVEEARQRHATTGKPGYTVARAGAGNRQSLVSLAHHFDHEPATGIVAMGFSGPEHAVNGVIARFLQGMLEISDGRRFDARGKN